MFSLGFLLIFSIPHSQICEYYFKIIRSDIFYLEKHTYRKTCPAIILQICYLLTSTLNPRLGQKRCHQAIKSNPASQTLSNPPHQIHLKGRRMLTNPSNLTKNKSLDQAKNKANKYFLRYVYIEPFQYAIHDCD